MESKLEGSVSYLQFVYCTFDDAKQNDELKENEELKNRPPQ